MTTTDIIGLSVAGFIIYLLGGVAVLAANWAPQKSESWWLEFCKNKNMDASIFAGAFIFGFPFALLMGIGFLGMYLVYDVMMLVAGIKNTQFAKAFKDDV